MTSILWFHLEKTLLKLTGNRRVAFCVSGSKSLRTSSSCYYKLCSKPPVRQSSHKMNQVLKEFLSVLCLYHPGTCLSVENQVIPQLLVLYQGHREAEESLSVPLQSGRGWMEGTYLVYYMSFPEAIVINHPTVHSLKQQKCIISHFWMPEVWNHGVSKATLPLENLREKLPWPLSFLVATSHQFKSLDLIASSSLCFLLFCTFKEYLSVNLEPCTDG